MATAYPAAIDSFVAKQDNVDDVEAVNINDLQEAIEALEAKVGVTSSAVTASIDYKVNNFFATGRKVYLYENTAPTGWSITAVTDKVLAVKGGSDAYNTTGGTTAGTWTQPNHTHTGPSHTHPTPNHTHDLAEQTTGLTSSAVGPAVGERTDVSTTVLRAWTTGGSGAAIYTSRKYSTETSGSGTATAGGTGATGGSATAATYRPYAAVGIICTKA